MILTPTTEKNLHRLELALSSSTAVLVQGEIGTGKTSAIQTLADRVGFKEKMIQINVDDSFDSKDLLGKYSATDTPGVFEWVSGPLTVAVERGYWILMEDIDLASFDVFSVILTLLESKTLFISDKNISLKAHPDFKIIATQQLFSFGSTLLTKKSAAVPYVELWGVVVMQPIPSDEVCQIVKQLYGSIPSQILHELAGLSINNLGTPLVNLRNLLKWSSRAAKRLTGVSSSRDSDFISSGVREILLKEAFDCFVAKFPPGKERDETLSLIAGACGIPMNVAEPLVLENKPLDCVTDQAYTVGKVSLPLFSRTTGLSRDSRVAFAPTTLAMSLLERLASSVESKEHVLLTGETGVGKTFIVQYLADKLGQKLIVHNLNQQTDTTDFMGGWKPLDLGVSVRELFDEFVSAFSECFTPDKNTDFLQALNESLNQRKWERAIKLMLKGCKTYEINLENAKKDATMDFRWINIKTKADEILGLLDKSQANFSFRFEEGSLVKAFREGHWILLDELNLATNEVLERVSSVLGDVDRMFLTDKATEPILRHKNFHVFANMNPPTDVGKKDLPPSLRARFTEYYVSEPFNRSDISVVVREYIGFLTADAKVDEITQFFLDCVENAKTSLCSLDGESKPPSFSLRTLTRALSYIRKATPFYGFAIALFDGLLLGFATPLQRKFHSVVEDLIVKNIFRGKRPPPPSLPKINDGNYISYEHIWILSGADVPFNDEGFILTPSVKGHLRNLSRAVFANRPVLLEGPTSSGKSSMVKFLADLTGNHFVRINNHDSTEVQEYLGHYVTDEYGKLRFVDGILVTAVRNGYWVVLDELNLAPSDVLEALNRLLDDNCELFIPDTQETIKPHPQLRIFATQNPAGIYGGRKMLSRAFRNRFLEITVDEIPNEEISYILQKRYSLPESFSDKMVEIMTALQVRRQNSQIFAGKHGFITPRDLFRWAERKPRTYQELAEHGFLLLGERCRKEEERQTVKDVIESVTKTELNEAIIYSPSHWDFVNMYFSKVENTDTFGIVWTESMQRLFTVVGICLEHQEPVLLVGETGSSKTTVCQLWASLLDIPLHIINCHQHTEAADFLGGLRPAPPERRDNVLFEWQNGPLVHSMLNGHYFLLDEISLTEDSVLERLNSVLEPSRTVTLAEKSSADLIVAHERFRVLATMNPGGDFGKKELSPALRNRFTEIYVRPTTDIKELTMIISKRLDPNLGEWASKMATTLKRISSLGNVSGAQHVSIRDIISWVSFMNAANGKCPADVSFLHGVDAVILDGIGVGTGQSEVSATTLRETFLDEISKWVPNLEEIRNEPFWKVFSSMEEPTLPVEMQKQFFFGAPTTTRNLSKLMRASIVRKAVLLEGSPGVGKTSIVVALGYALGHPVVRINLSEQTDIMDLFGTYLPCPNNEGEGPRFAWSDGVLLQALKEGSWVVLDELNLASQTVLEGLNALLDHRSTVFIPELNKEFHAHPDFRVFACQNPLIEGGGRKGLPKSFLNRFIKARIESFKRDDLLCIVKAVNPDIQETLLENMVDFVEKLQNETMVKRTFGLRGGPWEFNLRDVLRWIHMMRSCNAIDNPLYFADVLFVQRMRTESDRTRCKECLSTFFPQSQFLDSLNSDFLMDDSEQKVYFEGRCVYSQPRSLLRNARSRTNEDDESESTLFLLPSQAELVKSILLCANNAQFALLTGPTGSGKSFSLRTAAYLAGATLVTFSMNASCDTVDLLGGFDQVEGKQGQFEWRDSLVVEAMLQGYWLVLDNVNYCNASVLDRLNPLVEPNGVLSINEQGLVDGEVRVIKPHPNFRLFATLNPKYGEISRAMRNRAVELYTFPFEIPSSESLVLSYGSGTSSASQPSGNVDDNSTPNDTSFALLLDKLHQFHRRFIKCAFLADTLEVSSPTLSDALSVGSPNVFTLLRASSMLKRYSTSEGLREVILHCYVENRSGHWRDRIDSILDDLEGIMASEDLFTSTAPILDLANCLKLKEDGESLGANLVFIRVQRSSLGLAKTIMDNDHSDLLNAQRTTYDNLIFFVLDQCNDSIQLDDLSNARKQLLESLGIPENIRESLLDSKFSCAGALHNVWCRSLELIGAHADSFDLQNLENLQPTSAPHINLKILSILHECITTISSVADPVVFQTILRIFSPLRKTLINGKLSSNNYIDLVTVLLLLHEVSNSFGFKFASQIEEFLELLQRHLGLQFPLIGGESPLVKTSPKPRIASAEELGLMKAWKGSLLSNANKTTRNSLLFPLWMCASFRAEFALILSLLKISQDPQQNRVTEGELQQFYARVSSFIKCFTQDLPIFTDLEVTLWVNLLSLKTSVFHAYTHEAIASLAPLIITSFFTRFNVDGVGNLFIGSWTSSAVRCVQNASESTILDIRSSTNKNAHVLDGLLNFLVHNPIVKESPFTEVKLYARRDLIDIISTYFPQASRAQLRITPLTSLKEKVKDVLNAALADGGASSELRDNDALLRKILDKLQNANCNMYSVMTLLWALKCRLLLPNSPIDPMYKLNWQIKISLEEESILEKLDGVFCYAESFTLRGASTLQKELLSSVRKFEEQQLMLAKENYVVRPDESGVRYAELVQRLYQIRSSLLSDDRLESLSSEGENWSTVQRNWSSLIFEEISSILSTYAGYEDVTLNFCQSALFAMIANQANSYSGALEKDQNALFSRDVTFNLLQFPYFQVEKVPLPDKKCMLHSLKQYLSYLDSSLSLLLGSCAVSIDFTFAKDLFEAYRLFYQRVEQLEEEERRAEEMSVLYKEKAVVIEGDDERMLRRIKELFPSYEQEFLDLVDTQDANDEEQDEESGKDPLGNIGKEGSGKTKLQGKASQSAKHARILLKQEKNDFVRRLVDGHRRFYSNLISPDALNVHVDSGALLQSYKMRFTILSRDILKMSSSGSFVNDLECDSGISESLLMAGFSCHVAQLKRDLEEPLHSVKERNEANFNIFKDPEPSELSRFSAPLQSLIDAIEKLLDKYPDTNSLLRCRMIATRIASMPVLSTPLMKVMAGCEVLLKECYEWERNASSEVSLINHMTELSAFVLRWRRLELHCWKHVFNTKKEEFELQAYLEWFKFYDVIREDYDNEVSFCVRIFEYLSRFMWSSNFGDFAAKLRIIDGFANELIATCGFGAPSVNTLFHIIDYFNQFSKLINEQYKRMVEPIEEDMMDFTKIMRWEDANYYAVRATSEKSHLKVARVLGSLEEVLRTPILTCIQAEEQRCEEDASMGFTVEVPNKKGDESKGKKSKSKGDGKKRDRGGKKKREERGAQDKNRDGVVITVEDDLKIGDLEEALEFFTESSEELISQVARLQQPKTSNQLKIRALKTLFDTMSENGVPQTHETQIIPWEVLFPSFESLLGCRQSRSSEHSNSSFHDAVKGASESYYKFTRWIQRMRDAKKKPSDDLSGGQVTRGTSMIESLLSDSIEVTNLINITYAIRSDIEVLDSVTGSMHVSNVSKEHSHAPTPEKLLDNCIQFCSQAKCFHDSIEFLQRTSTLKVSDIDHIPLKELAILNDELWNICQKHDLLRGVAIEFPHSIRDQCSNAVRKIAGVVGRIRDSESFFLSAAGSRFEKHCLEVLEQLETSALEPTSKKVKSEELNDSVQMAKAALQAVDRALLVYSNVEKKAEAETPFSYPAYKEIVLSLKKAFESESRVLKDSLVHYGTFAIAGTEQTEVRNNCRRLLSTLDLLGLKLITVLREHSRFGIVLARLFTILMKKGFCKTEDEDNNNEDGEGEGEQQNGTGMDDGEGEKDVTDQIENEDQLMNMKDKEEQTKEEKEKDEEEEDNAADVETDFKGEKETREESEQDEEGENDEEESDKEVGSVDEEDERDRKRTRKDENDDNDMREDDGDKADEVPEDEFGEENNDEETGGFADKEKEIKEAEEEREGEHELVADDDAKGISDDEADSSDDPSVDKSDSDGPDKDEDAEDDNEKNDLEESEEGNSIASDNRYDEDAPTDEDIDSKDGEREIDNEENSEAPDDDASYDSNSDGADENIFEGGQQDELQGRENTENRKEKTEKNQPDTMGNEEEQAGDEQEMDDAGRNWKKQQDQNMNAQRKDNTEQNRAKQNNPYKAVKEALKRHQQQIQQLNLNQQVDVKDDDKRKEEKNPNSNDQQKDDKVEEFDFDSEGEMEGMAATDKNTEKPSEVNEADLRNQSEDASEAESSADDKEDDNDSTDAPQDVRKRRKKPVDNINEIEEDKADDSKDDKPKSKKKVKMTSSKQVDDDASESTVSGNDEDEQAEENVNAKLQKGRELWQAQEAAVQGLSQQLCEQLRLILAPTLADKLQGDYKTGKRLNMKRIIPYIASQYKKDRIWLRRTKPNKRTYQILVALDDSMSMRSNNAGELSCRAVTLIAKALQQLEIGEMGIITFGRESTIIHKLEDQFIADSGPRAFSEITFDQKSTNLKNFLENTLEYLDSARDRQRGQTRSTTQQLQQVLFVISDGQITEDRSELKKLMARAETNNQMVVFILLDIKEEGEETESKAAASPITAEELKGLSTAERTRRLKQSRESRLKRVQSKSILDMQIVEFKGSKVVRKSYMEDFPFPYYVIVREIDHLPEIVSDAMRQWFELLTGGN